MLEPDFSHFPQLETERLVLRKISGDDSPAIYSLRSDERAMKYIDKPSAKNIEEAAAFIVTILDWLEKNEAITWGIALKEKPEFLIGTIGYWRMKKEHYRAEIGYMLHPDHWKQGLMKEAICRVLGYGFNELKLHSIEAHINPYNAGSAAILESTGFVREAYFKEDYYYNGKFLDTAIYSRLQ
jgi:ribosomal-protein-alanine N-acetyltransferase